MPSMIKPATAIIRPQKKYFLALKLASRLILTKNWTYKSFRRPSYLPNWASVVLLRTMEEAQGGLVGALEIPAADASEDLPPESEPILCCIWPAGQPIRIKEVTSRDQSASLLQSKLRSAAHHCLPLSFACNPYHGKFWERRQGNLLYARSEPAPNPPWYQEGLFDPFWLNFYFANSNFFFKCLVEMSDKQCNQARRGLLNSKICFYDKQRRWNQSMLLLRY